MVHSYRLLFLLLGWLIPLYAGAGWLHRDAAIMGTSISVELWTDDIAHGEALVEQVLAEMRRIDTLMSTWKPDSELSRVNRLAAREPVPVSDELFRLIGKALDYSVITHGAFDITYASAGYLYDFRKGRHPTPAQLAAAVPEINWHFVQLDPAHTSVRFLHKGVRIDLGGIAKGYAVDRCIELLQHAGIQDALVSAGGDSRVIGNHRDHPWNVGIRDPRRHDGLVSIIPLENAAISTSGDYERFFEENGVRYHHIIDPVTGDSARRLRSASIIASLATDTDALSTSVFVLGVEKGLQLINTLPDTEAILVDNDGKLHYSDGLETAKQQPQAAPDPASPPSQ
jgi:FAD:protein FMN transferase